MGRKQCDLCHICAKMNFSLVMCNGLNVYKQKPFLIQATISSPVASITNVFNQSSVQINIQYNFFQWGKYLFQHKPRWNQNVIASKYCDESETVVWVRETSLFLWIWIESESCWMMMTSDVSQKNAGIYREYVWSIDQFCHKRPWYNGIHSVIPSNEHTQASKQLVHLNVEFCCYKNKVAEKIWCNESYPM
jgi:hypothetical protein